MIVEIRIHGTGGQGAVVAIKLLADAAVKSGYKAQSFAAYGAERRGGKVEAFVRIATGEIRVHSKVYNPDYLIIMDESLADLKTVSGLKEGGGILINSAAPPGTFASLGDFRISTVDASSIAREQGILLPNGTPVINTTVLGAVAAIIPLISIDHVLEAIKEGEIPATEKNIKATKEAYYSVKSSTMPSAVVGQVERKEAPKASVERYPVFQMMTSPCEANCPAGQEIRKTISLLQSGQFGEALKTMRDENPFPGMCGRVCFHPCETKCNRSKYDDEIAISALERAAFDYGYTSRVTKRKGKEKTGKKVAIIGSGPAGMSCAYFLALLGHNVTIFEALPVLGGIPRVAIPEYRLPKDVVDKETGQVIELGIDVRMNTEVGKDVSFEYVMKKNDACFIAAGAHRSMKLNIPGEDSEGVVFGLEFLKEVTSGRKSELGARVVVIGGGNVAIDAARTAKRLGAREICILCLESRTTMPAYQTEVEAATREGIKILHRAMPVQIIHNGKQVTGLECSKVKGGKRDKTGWLKWPQKINGADFTLRTDMVIVAIGAYVEVPFISNIIAMNGRLIDVDYLGRTSTLGVYAGGDATMVGGSVVEAIGSGKRAALGIDIYLKGTDDKQIVRTVKNTGDGAICMGKYLTGEHGNGHIGIVSFEDLNPIYFSRLARAQTSEVSPARRISNFDEVNLALSEREVIEEANRCFYCGRCNFCENCYIFCPEVAITLDEKTHFFTVNHDSCKRCGICIEECPRTAISWKGELSD
jgi:2-oxoacid:acceptor oxidoreductase gamma subunit (pyruvate/2-ketoisovalerate family)